MTLVKSFRENIKIFFAQNLFRFEGISLSKVDTRVLLDQKIMHNLNFDSDQTQIIKNVINGLDFLEENFDSLSINLDSYKKFQAILANQQALKTGVLRTGNCYIHCIEEPIEPVSERQVNYVISDLNYLNEFNYKESVPDCFTRLARMQPFYDGNKRSSLFLCNLALLKKDLGAFFITNEKYPKFEDLLTDFYTGKNKDILPFLSGCVYSKQELKLNFSNNSLEHFKNSQSL